MESLSSPRISFSAEFLDENNFISICPNPRTTSEKEIIKPSRNVEFEFLSGKSTNMIAADELFSEGKLLPFWQMHQPENLNNITLKSTENADVTGESDKNSKPRINWQFLDDDPSPRPPKCTVLWKELLRLKKQRASSTLTSSTSPSSSSSSETPSEKKEGIGNKEKVVKRIKKGLERTRSANIRIRPVINVPICNQPKNNTALMPPLFSSRKGKLLER
ncbi:uncharacterized protein [Henckelia pumila]|uniref:uncharacterized protein n=1 Tax=Henckelia pumila TaxID=405737 RepID=UPI003C6E7717